MLIFDDILHSGGTSWETYLLLKRMGYEDINLYATHAVLSNQAWMRFLPSGDRAGFNRIYTTNSVPSMTERYLKHFPETFTVLDLTPITVDFIFKKYKYSKERLVHVWYGTESKPKVDAIKRVFPSAQLLPHVNRSSGVNPQPFGIEEIVSGTKHRLKMLLDSWISSGLYLETQRQDFNIFVAIESGLVHDPDQDLYRDHTVVLCSTADPIHGVFYISSESEAVKSIVKSCNSSAANYLVGPQIPKTVFEAVKESQFQITAGKILCKEYPEQKLDDADWYHAVMPGIVNQPISRADYIAVHLNAILTKLKEQLGPSFHH